MVFLQGFLAIIRAPYEELEVHLEAASALACLIHNSQS